MGDRSPLGTEDGRWLSSSEQRVWRHLLAVHTQLVDQLDRDLVELHRIRLGDYEVLVWLSEAPDRSMRMSELAGHLLLSPSGLTRRIDGLVRDGLVVRRACPSDGRGSLAELTDAGLARLREAAPTHVAGVQRYVIEPLGGAGLARLEDGLDAMSHALTGYRPVSTPG